MGQPRYGPAQVRAQMQAGYDNGVHDWMLWNSGSRYTVSAFQSTRTCGAWCAFIGSSDSSC
jgi:hypothetical protein